MLYVPFVASFCALTSVVSAAPVALEDRGLLSGLIGGVTGSSSKVTKLNTIVSGLQTSTAPLLANIQLLTGSQDAVNTLVGSLLDNTVVDVDANVTVGGLGGLGGIGGGSSPISLAPLESLVSGLSGSGLDTGMVTDLASALTNLGSVDNNGLYTLIQQLLTVTSQLQTAQSQIQSLIASSGANSILASLTNTGTIVTALNSITTQLFLAINSVSTNLVGTLDDASTDVTQLNAALQALQAPLDASTAQIIVGANTIVNGITTLLRSSLLVTSALKNLATLNGLATTLQSLVAGLGLTNLQSVLKL